MKRYSDRYLQGVGEAFQSETEQERQLRLFLAWLNVRKKLQLPDEPEKLLKEFLALEQDEEEQ